MTKCLYCGADTWLYDGGSPVCLRCSNDLEHGRKPAASAQSQTPPENKKTG